MHFVTIFSNSARPWIEENLRPLLGKAPAKWRIDDGADWDERSVERDWSFLTLDVNSRS